MVGLAEFLTRIGRFETVDVGKTASPAFAERIFLPVDIFMGWFS